MKEKVPAGTVREFRGKQSIGWAVLVVALPLCGALSLVLYSVPPLFIVAVAAAALLRDVKFAKESREILFRLTETELAVFWKGREWRYPRDQLTVTFYASKVWTALHHDIICSMGETKDRFPDMLSWSDRCEFIRLVTKTKREEEKERERFLPAMEWVLKGEAIEYELYPEHRARAWLRLHGSVLLFMYGAPLVFGAAPCLLFAAMPFETVGLVTGVLWLATQVSCIEYIIHSPSAFTLPGLIRYRMPSRLRLDMDGLTVNDEQIPFASVSSITLGISSFDRQRQNSFVLLLRRRRKPVAPNITLRLGISFEDGDPAATIFPHTAEFIAVLSAVCKKRPLPFKVIQVDHPLMRASSVESYPKDFPH